MSIPFYKHDLGWEEVEAIKKVFDGSILTTGAVVEEFEVKFSKLTSNQFTLGVTSCTGALHMALMALDIGPGDEVITTPMTFIATASAIICAGAKPVFVDVEKATGNIDPNHIERAITKKTKAIIPVHLYGQMCDMVAIKAIADKYGLKVIEDSAHCVEGMRDGFRPGNLSDAACFSFYATKNLTCGEGGAISFNNPLMYEKLKLLRLHGMTKSAADREKNGYEHWNMKLLGWKYNLDNIQAAILLPQLERLNDKLQMRENLASLYNDNLKNINGIRLFDLAENCIHARHLYPIQVLNKPRDSVLEGLQKMGIGVVVNYRAIHLLDYFKNHLKYCIGDFPFAEEIGNNVISLPFFPGMASDQVNEVCENLLGIV
jgi:dTDP-4-amino-4,6-dideoxygalactose transaminase